MNSDDEAALMNGGHSTLRGALGAYRRRLEEGDRFLATHGIGTVPAPPRQPEAPHNPDFGGGQRGITPAERPPTMNELIRAATSRDRSAALSRWRNRR